ncbi:MAG: hypothetical protein ACI9U2_000666 [Bradymonadia bacterium]|jgi:hypothetical protein
MSALFLGGALVLMSCSPPLVKAPAPIKVPAVEKATTLTAHPGTIVFVDADGSESSRPMAEVPESIAWGQIGARRIPIVRVVRTAGGGVMEITRYGPGGEEVDRTIGPVPPPPLK